MNFRVIFWVLSSLVGHCFFDYAHGKVAVGVIKSNLGWEFVERFCFYPNIGKLHFTFSYPVQSTSPKILVYPDALWPTVYKNSSKNCQQKVATIDITTNQVFYLSPAEAWTNCRLVKPAESASLIDTGGTIRCSAVLSFLSSRERWWYMVVSDCGQPIDLSYDLLFLNGDGIMTKHFSADEFYILEVDIAFLFTFATMLIMSLVFANKLKELNYLHITYNLFIYSLLFKCLHLFVICIGLGKFSSDGLDVYGAKVVGHVMEAISFLIFILLLILFGKGLTITRGKISMTSMIKITVFMILYVCIYVAFFIWEAVVFDRALVLYRYESYPGYCLLVIQVTAWLWFTYATFFTVKNYPEKKYFYYPFYLLYTLWFLAGPICVLIANLALDLWVREKVANGIFHTINFFGYAFLLFLTRPSKANKNFPYHIKATQIAAMQEDSNSDNNNNNDNDNDNNNKSNINDLGASYKSENNNSWGFPTNRQKLNLEFYDIFKAADNNEKVAEKF
ncbi:hypothetical protein HELRODRAFT_100932 [Helobdella robusta]|uniref:Uncharacterized protein n=1 Tax=Helobdella robusta TaxID=6412 RepID=T1ED20_HELRO|nr:hypothetical protein HELRODRAFT_100932 [Helobdella robusta]ESO00944.1 hypothetical protein HELRODRAFT_100932 [Helobdella robusta]